MRRVHDLIDDPLSAGDSDPLDRPGELKSRDIMDFLGGRDREIVYSGLDSAAS